MPAEEIDVRSAGGFGCPAGDVEGIFRMERSGWELGQSAGGGFGREECCDEQGEDGEHLEKVASSEGVKHCEYRLSNLCVYGRRAGLDVIDNAIARYVSSTST